MQRRTDDEILREVAARYGMADHPEALRGTLAYQLALLGERFGDLGWAIASAFGIPQLVDWLNRKLSHRT